MTELPPPVFIHSLFRSGSTYLFDVFRQSPAKYWCYQEPENEILLELADTTDPVADTGRANALLRHPPLDRPYLAEFMPIRDEVVRLFRRDFPYDSFFLAEEDEEPDLRRYLELLITHAQGRAVLQFCRSTGRIDWLRRNFGGRHLFLWRHPWDQWWSYKVTPYFDTANLLILNAHKVPPVFEEIRTALRFAPHRDTTLEREFAYFDSHGLNDKESYFLFFAIWYHAMHEGLRSADADIGIDALSRSAEYRQEMLGRLEAIGIAGLDFSSCAIPQSCFLDTDRAFFLPIEERVHRLFERHGYPAATAARIADLVARMPSGEPEPAKDLERIRELARRNFSAASSTKRLIWEQRLEIERLTRCETELLSIYHSRPWKIVSPLMRVFWNLRARFRKTQAGADATNTARSAELKS